MSPPDTITHRLGRYYWCEGTSCWLPSVSTVMGFAESKKYEAWANQPGSYAIRAKALSDGEKFHEAVEVSLSDGDGESVYPGFGLFMANGLAEVLDNIEEVVACETKMVSPTLAMGGRVDLIAKISGDMVCIDFKTAKSIRHRTHYPHYFCQAAAYAIMYEELFGVAVPNIMIVMCEKGSGKVVTMVDKAVAHAQDIIKRRREWDADPARQCFMRDIDSIGRDAALKFDSNV